MRDLLLCCALILCALPSRPATAASSVPAPPCEAGEPIAEHRFVTIGGIPQWLSIEGHDCGNPVVLMVHGGPGNPSTPYAGNLYGAWLDEFTLVQWDQRGAGMTFGRTPMTEDDAPLTIERLAADGNEVAEYLSRRLDRPTIVLFGSSWGSALGVTMAQARPDLYAGYLGTAQMVSHRENLEATWRAVHQRATAIGDDETLALLDGFGPPPWRDPRAFGAVRRVTRRYEATPTEPAPVQWWTPTGIYADSQALDAYEQGEEYSYLQLVGLEGDGMLSRLDLPALGIRFAMAVALVQGEEDLVTMPSVSRRYFDAIQAPHKRFVSLPRTGHDPNPAMVDAQLALLRNWFVPLLRPGAAANR